ncbi:unnamed protein product [Callosobruchus maculatus]|uniref:ubiquitinyl hydrolase 1 n=1 Tax=Callosobruchus maculatus TaxID=64391 RepID=A0A653DRR2_CALMS|nr:unnamed protein product [Callosobruchus maculatus]
MCESATFNGVKSNSTGLLDQDEMTLIPEATLQANELSKLKRTFTFPRNPFNTVRMSKRRPKAKDENDLKIVTNDTDVNKKVFRRPSIRKFIHKIAQHIGGVPGINQNIENNRVPPVGLQTWGPDDTPGVTGLKNHGNTCFINAVLQCISHTDILAEYFVLDRYKIDLSRRNKLNSKKFGTKGEVTEQLALLLKALWACQYSPELSTNFKQIVERHGAQYKGTQQHDALEFLQWLLDKVHEDLNTASKRKFKSIKTSGRPDEVIAAETLENYKRCNNSFIQGVFQAQYRSSLSCSRCRTQSNTFDPFQCISVQLPQFHKHSIYVTVLYTCQQPRQVRIGVTVAAGATVGELRSVLASDTSIAPADMLLLEVGPGGFQRTLADAQPAAAIADDDPLYCVEAARLDPGAGPPTGEYVLLCWVNVAPTVGAGQQPDDGGEEWKRFGSPYTMQVSRETSYDDLQKLILKEMAPILHDDILTSSQPRGIFSMRVWDPAAAPDDPPLYLDPELQHPLYTEAVEQALALCGGGGDGGGGGGGGPAHVKLTLEWRLDAKASVVADDQDSVEEHASVRALRQQAAQGGAPLTLEECLRDYTEAETLTDAWRCPHCQQYQPVVKTLDMWSLPEILIVHFKRFRQHGYRTGNSAKLTTMVDFPVTRLDMSPHLAAKRRTSSAPPLSQPTPPTAPLADDGWSSPWKRSATCKTALSADNRTSGDNLYDLYAVCYHHGTDLETGHYTAACKNPYDSQWYLYDDSKVVNLSRDSADLNSVLVNNSAYILFYQKRNGIFGGSSSNSSSAASTSSVGSMQEHWVSRMPRFVPPKFASGTVTTKKEPEKAAAATTTTNTVPKEDIFEERQHHAGDAVAKALNTEEEDDRTAKQVALRNSQNTLHSSQTSIRKSTTSESKPAADATSKDVEHSNPVETHPTEAKKPPMYTTSIYINASGDVDIETRCTESPVLSNGRLSGEEEDVVLREGRREVVYTTTASVHRHSDTVSSARDHRSARTQFSFMSPQPVKKSQMTPQSV